jgi:perosamine synthetase
VIYDSILPFSLKELAFAIGSLLSRVNAIRLFENNLGRYLGQEVIAVDSGLTAIKLYLRAKGLTRGDEIALPAYLCERVGMGLQGEGYSLNFIDVCNDYNMSPEDLEKKISARTKVVIAVHSYGIPCKMEEIRKVAGRFNASVLDDSAQSLGGSYRGGLLGTLGDAGVYSFGTIKPMTAMGGGALVSQDKELIERARKLLIAKPDFKSGIIKLFKGLCYLNKPFYFTTVERLYQFSGRDRKGNSLQPVIALLAAESMNGNTSTFLNLQAAMALVQLERIDDFNKKRVSNSLYLAERLSHLPIKFPRISECCPLIRMPVKFTGLTLAGTLKVFKQYLKSGICAPALYPYLPEMMGISADCPNAKALSEQTLNIPVHPCLKKRQMDKLIRVTEEICRVQYSL